MPNPTNDVPGPFPSPGPGPDWWDPPPQTPQPSASALPSAPGSRDLTVTRTAANKPVPIPYGLVSLPGMFLFGPRVYGANLVSTWLFCIGGASGIQGITELRLTGLEGIAWANGTHEETRAINLPNGAAWVQAQQFHGIAAQVVSPLITQFEPTYADDNIDTTRGMSQPMVYLAMYQSGHFSDEVAVPTAVIQGLKCWDPRLSGGAGAFAYTVNPALWLADFLTQPHGANSTVDWDSVETTADRCDELVNGKPRWWGGAAILEDRPIAQHIERLRAIANCMVRKQGGTYFLIPNAPRSSVFTFDKSNIVKDSVRVEFKDILNNPTRVECSFTSLVDTQDEPLWPWNRNRRAVYDDGTQPGITSVVALQDAQSHEVAYRYAVQQYRQNRFAPWHIELDTRDMAAALHLGEVVTVDHPELSASAKDMMITTVKTRRQGHGFIYRVICDEYDPGMFSDDDVLDTPFEADPEFSATNPPDLTSAVTAVEVIDSPIDEVLSRLRITFVAEDYPYTEGYAAVVVGPGISLRFTAAQETPGDVVEMYTTDLSGANIQPGGSVFSVSVTIVSTVGDIESANPKTTTVTVLGKWAPPPSTSIESVVFDSDTGVITVSAVPVVDIGGPMRYKWRWSVDPTHGWDDATTIGGTTADPVLAITDYPDEAATAYYVFVRPMDSSGVLAEVVARASVFIDPATRRAVRETFHAYQMGTIGGGWETFDVFGEGEFAISADEHTMEDRFGTAPAWTDANRPVYYGLNWATGAAERAMTMKSVYSTVEVRHAKYQAEIVATGTMTYTTDHFWSDGVTFNQNDTGIKAWRLLDEYMTDIAFTMANMNANPFNSVLVRFPVANFARVTPLSQSQTLNGLAVTSGAATTHVWTFSTAPGSAYSVAPSLVKLFASPTIVGGRTVILSVTSVTTAAVTFTAETAAGTVADTFNATLEVLGI